MIIHCILGTLPHALASWTEFDRGLLYHQGRAKADLHLGLNLVARGLKMKLKASLVADIQYVCPVVRPGILLGRILAWKLNGNGIRRDSMIAGDMILDCGPWTRRSYKDAGLPQEGHQSPGHVRRVSEGRIGSRKPENCHPQPDRLHGDRQL
jgi:hypothetical protein